MGKLVQRKRFDDPDLANEAADHINDPQWHVSGVTIIGEAVEIDGECWVYVTQEGEIVTDEIPLLPDYEKVD